MPDIPGIISTWKIAEAMTVTLKLKPEVEAWRGLAKAIREGSRGQGVDVDAMGSKPGRLTTTGWGPLRMTIQVTVSAVGLRSWWGRWAGMKTKSPRGTGSGHSPWRPPPAWPFPARAHMKVSRA